MALKSRMNHKMNKRIFVFLLCVLIAAIISAKYHARPTTESQDKEAITAGFAIDEVVRRTGIERGRLSTAVKRIGDTWYVSVWSNTVGEFFIIGIDDNGVVIEFNPGE